MKDTWTAVSTKLRKGLWTNWKIQRDPWNLRKPPALELVAAGEETEGPKPAARGGWMGAGQNFFEIRIVGLYPENHPSP